MTILHKHHSLPSKPAFQKHHSIQGHGECVQVTALVGIMSLPEAGTDPSLVYRPTITTGSDMMLLDQHRPTISREDQASVISNIS